MQLNRTLKQGFATVILASVTLALLYVANAIIADASQELIGKNSAPKTRERVFFVSVRKAELETLTPYLEVFGEIRSRRRLELRSARGGRVVFLSKNFEDGGTVAADEVLVEFDLADVQSAHDRAMSGLLDAQFEYHTAQRLMLLVRDELRKAVAQMDLHARALQRQQDLQTRGFAAAAHVDEAERIVASARQSTLSHRIALAQAETRVDQAMTSVLRARIALEAAERDVENMTVRAGFGGTLTDAALVEGQLVAENEKLAELLDPDMLEVMFQVSTSQYVRLLDDDGALIDAPVTVSSSFMGTDLKASGRISRDSGIVRRGHVFMPGWMMRRVSDPGILSRFPLRSLGWQMSYACHPRHLMQRARLWC